MLKVLLWALLAYFLYRFLFNFLLPLIGTTRQIRSQVKEFQNRMHDQQQSTENNYPKPDTHTPHRSNTPPSRAGEYIEFEELK